MSRQTGHYYKRIATVALVMGDLGGRKAADDDDDDDAEVGVPETSQTKYRTFDNRY